MNGLMKAIIGTLMIAVVAVAAPAHATPILHNLTLNQTAPTAATIMGTFSIDDSLLLPNTQIFFNQFLSFSISVAGLNWGLANAVLPNTEGVVTDGTGEVFRFNDTLGNLTEFCMGCSTFLRFTDNSFNYDTQGGRPTPTSGTYSISRAVPEPATLLLLGTGLAVVGYRRRRLQH